MPEIAELRTDDIDASFAAAWDALPPARGVRADIYDSHAWFSAWLSASPKWTAERVRIVAVLDGGRPIAILPILKSSNGRRAAVIGMESRTRVRPIVGSEQPSQDLLGLLAEAVARTGVCDLNLHRMPSSDPATAAFVAAMHEAGYRVVQHERSADNLAPADLGWQEYVQGLRGFAKYAKRFTNRLESLWSVDVDTYGVTPERTAVDGFDIYLRLHGRSWRQELSAADRERRVNLLTRAEEHGWARVFVLRLDRVPAAAHIWFRLGDVAIWHSTAFDQQLAALSPGTVMMWQAQSKIFEGGAPLLVDLLPGTTPEKERLTASSPPLLVTEAVKPSPWSGTVTSTRRHVRRVRSAVADRIRVHGQNSSASPRYAHVLTTTVSPDQEGTAWRLSLTAAHERYIAAATGHASPRKMSEGWATDDEWWIVGDGPSVLIHIGIGQDGVVGREIIRLESETDLTDAVKNVASALGREVDLRETPVFEPVLPWPRSWTSPDSGRGK